MKVFPTTTLFVEEETVIEPLAAFTFVIFVKIISIVINSAALVKHFGDFEMFKSINVVGTKNEVLVSFISNYYKENLLPKEIVAIDLTEEDKSMLQEFLLSNYSKVTKITIPKIGLKKGLVENANKNANEFLEHFQGRIERKYQMTQVALEKLKEVLKLERLYRIEGFDISNISGEFSVASMVVFERGEPAYKEYRKFKRSG